MRQLLADEDWVLPDEEGPQRHVSRHSVKVVEIAKLIIVTHIQLPVTLAVTVSGWGLGTLGQV